MTAGSDNKFPKVIITEGTAPSSPSAGDQKLYIDSSDHKLKRKNSSGTVTTIEGGGSVATDTIWDTKGDLAVATGADAASKLAVGSDGQVLTADSAQTTGVKWAAAGGGGSLVFLEAHTASSSATLDFTTAISSTYDTYVIELVQIIPATNAVNLWFRVSTDGGSTYDTTAIYSYVDYRWIASGASNGGAGSQAQTLITNGTDTVSNSSSYGVCGRLELYNPGGAIYKRLVGQVGYLNSSSALEGLVHSSVYASNTAVNAFRFLFSSGNIASGIIRVYGLTKS